MADLKNIDIPEKITNIERAEDKSLIMDLLSEFDSLRSEPKNAAEFFEKFTNLIHFEEVAASKKLFEYNLYSAGLTIILREQQTCEIVCMDKNLTPWVKAFNDKKNWCIRIQPVSFNLDGGLMILGHVKSTESCKIIIQITHGFNTLLDVHYINEVDDLTGDVVQGTNKRLFDIQFQTNRTPFLLQHNALR